MGLYLNTDTDEQIPLASNAGWSQFGAWVDGLDDSFTELSHLWEYGWSEPVADLREQLLSAIHSTPPNDADTAHTAKQLLESLSRLQDEGAVVVTDGMESEPKARIVHDDGATGV